MKLPTSLAILACASILLWAVAVLAYMFGHGTEIIVAAFVLGCITAWIAIVQQLD
jgi:hypothetical protein